MLRVGVLGALGKMGTEVTRAVLEDDDLELACAVDPAAGEGDVVGASGVPVQSDISCMEGRDVDVCVDFTHAGAAAANILDALGLGIHCVVGTTGFSEEQLEEIRARAEGGKANVLIAPNFATGAVMMMKAAEMAARVFDQCEIIEFHHRGKKDSPSGTAIATARRIAAAMDASDAPASVQSEVEGARGGSVGPVHIHSVRLDGLVAHQEVIFGSRGQTLTIRHDTTDRSCFMPGVIIAVKAIEGLPGLTIGLDSLL
jgi:4-hydroxy-tetrahydrodipicolinate reductase